MSILFRTIAKSYRTFWPTGLEHGRLTIYANARVQGGSNEDTIVSTDLSISMIHENKEALARCRQLSATDRLYAASIV